MHMLSIESQLNHLHESSCEVQGQQTLRSGASLMQSASVTATIGSCRTLYRLSSSVLHQVLS